MINGRIDLYINRKNREWFEQLQVIAHMSNISLASMIGEAVEIFVREHNGKPKLIANQKFWNTILENCTKEELAEWNRLISSLNNKILKHL